MRLTLVNKFFLSILGVLVLAVVSNAVALFGSRQIRNLFEVTAYNFLPSVRSTAELEIAFLEQRGCLASYILDGGKTVWLDQLRQREPAFDQWLMKSENTSNAPEEDIIVSRLKEVNRQYEAKRDEVVAIFDRGDESTAKSMLFGEVNTLYERVFEQCEKYIEANQRHVDQAIADSKKRINMITAIVGASVVMTVIGGAALFWLFANGVMRPLRTMVAEARGLRSSTHLSSDLMGDELSIMGEHFRALMVDVTDTRSTLAKSREQLMNAEKLASVGKLAASVAHEIRNPLTSIKMWLFSIRKAVGGDSQLDHKFDVVTGEINRLESIVRSFLEFSRPADIKLECVKVSDLIDKTLELFRLRMTERGVQLHREDQPDLPSIIADADQFKQMLLNLLDNAAQAIGPNGGQVRIATTSESDENGRKMVVLRIIDSGPGVSPDIADRIFEPFVTTKAEGTGLGLCIAAGIMLQHHGRLILESTSNHGTTFAVWFPAAEVTDS